MTDQPTIPAIDRPFDRNTLRRAMIAARQAFPADARRAASDAIARHLLDLLLPLTPGTLAFCWPIRAEVDCHPAMTQLLAQGWRAAMPVVERLAAPLTFRTWQPDAPMTADPYGIPIPDTPPVPPPDVLLIPLVAFDEAGYRLGYGGGYFDRTLAALNPRPLAIGVGFELGRVADLHPEPHDIRLDRIVTEAGVRHCDKNRPETGLA
jgi:5,10-methenyltetrahydrofolate synthetase